MRFPEKKGVPWPKHQAFHLPGLSLPLMAIAYSLGGISRAQVGAAVWLLVLACLQAGALALMVSSFCRTTTQAIVGTYLVGALFYLLVPLVYGSFLFLVIRFPRFGGRGMSDELLFLLPAYVYARSSRSSLDFAFVGSIPIVFSIGVFLLLARAFLIRRAFVPAKHLTLKVFRWLDGFMKSVFDLRVGFDDADFTHDTSPVLKGTHTHSDTV